MLEEQFSYDTNLIPKKGLKEYRRNGNHWKHNQLLQLQKVQYDKLLDILPTLNKLCAVVQRNLWRKSYNFPTNWELFYCSTRKVPKSCLLS